MCFVVVWLDGCDLFGLVRCDRVRRLDVRRFVLILDLLKCFGLAICLACALIVGPLALQLHVQTLELEQAREAEIILGWIEAQPQDTRIGEYRPD